MNLYAFARNNAINVYDLLGMLPVMMERFVVKEDRIRDYELFLYADGGSGGGKFSFDFGSGGGNEKTEEQKKKEEEEVKKKEEARQKVKKECDDLLAQITKVTEASMTLSTYMPPQNPMSFDELRTDVRTNAKNQVGGIIDAVTTATPGARLALELFGYIGAVTQIGQNVSNGSISGTDVALLAGSSVNYVNSIAVATTGKAVITGGIASAAKAAGLLGAGLTAVDVFGGPVAEYLSRSQPQQLPLDPRLLQQSWEQSVAPRLTALGANFQSKGCAEALGK